MEITSFPVIYTQFLQVLHYYCHAMENQTLQILQILQLFV